MRPASWDSRITGSGTLDDPRLEGRAAVSAFTLAGQRFGTLEATAHTAGHTLTYNVNAQLEEAALALRGETVLDSGYATKAQFDFSQFNIGVLFRMAHMEAFSGKSALAGTVTVEGPLAHPEQLHGEARLREIGGDHCRRSTAKRGRRARHAGQWTHPSRSSAHHRRKHRPARRRAASRSRIRARGNWILPPAAPST